MFLSKKKYVFQVHLTLEELISVPFLSSLLFVKVKLDSALSPLTYITKKYEVSNHTVRIFEQVMFHSKFTSKNDGLIQPLILHISIRRELMGGKSYEKLGYVNIDLSQYAGSGSSSQHFLLQNSNARSFNSILKVKILLKQIRGDSCFKIANPKPLPLPRILDVNSLFHQDIYCYPPDNDFGPFEYLPNPSISFISRMQTPNSNVLPLNRTDCLSPSGCFDNSDIVGCSLHGTDSSTSGSDASRESFRNKRLSTIDHPSERVSSSRISAVNVVEQIVRRESPHHPTCSTEIESICLLTLDKSGIPTLTSTRMK